MKRSVYFLTFGLGLLLAVVGFVRLKATEGALRPDGNPFAIQQSGYGKTLARLSQDTVNVVWHLGIEQVNPLGPEHANCDHNHGVCAHGDEEPSTHGAGDTGVVQDSLEALAAQAALPEADRLLLTESGFDLNQPHCADCLKTVIDSLKKGQQVAQADLPAIHAFHEMEEGADGHEGHDHGHDHAHDHEKVAKQSHGALDGAKTWLQDQRAAQYQRTSRFAISKAHQQAVGADIEKMLLRGYKMDPTDYGVYNAYFLFLTVHEYRGTPVALEHAKLVSRMTISAAMKEEVDPQPWLTACSATLNLFFLEQEELKAKGESAPVAMLQEFRDQMRYCLHRFEVTRSQAESEGRWDMISEARRKEMMERAHFSKMASEQFDVMLARATSGEGKASPEGKVAADQAENSVKASASMVETAQEESAN